MAPKGPLGSQALMVFVGSLVLWVNKASQDPQALMVHLAPWVLQDSLDSKETLVPKVKRAIRDSLDSSDLRVSRVKRVTEDSQAPRDHPVLKENRASLVLLAHLGLLGPLACRALQVPKVLKALRVPLARRARQATQDSLAHPALQVRSSSPCQSRRPGLGGTSTPASSWTMGLGRAMWTMLTAWRRSSAPSTP